MNRYTKLALALCLVPMLSWAQDAEQKAPASPVMVEAAQRDTFSATLWVSGTVISQNDARIAAETDGRITWVADVGSRIEEGEAIARIDAEDLRLDLADSELVVETASGGRKRVPLKTTVSRFYGAVMAAFERLGLPVSIDPLPSEIAGAIPFHEDMQHGPYDPAHAQLMLRAWIDSERVMNRFRARFIGKASPVQLYWGGFDLATYRFSGRTAPPHPGGAPNFPLDVAQESYTHEVTAVGLWFGSREVPQPSYFAYTYP